MAVNELLLCEECGLPARRYTNHTTKAKAVLCASHVTKRNAEAARRRAPLVYAKAVAELRAKRTAENPIAKPTNPVFEDRLIAGAVQRLVDEARTLEHPAPDPRSSNWIGRRLEREGWDRKVLTTALTAALDDGDLRLGKYRDDWGHRKREVLPALAGVAVKLTPDQQGA